MGMDITQLNVFYQFRDVIVKSLQSRNENGISIIKHENIEMIIFDRSKICSKWFRLSNVLKIYNMSVWIISRN